MENDMNIETQIKRADNGVNVDALLGAREALEAAPAAAQFTWRASCDWKGGVHSCSTIESFFGLGEEQAHSESFQIDADHPPHFAAEDNGATPTEILLSALASCLPKSETTDETKNGSTICRCYPQPKVAMVHFPFASILSSSSFCFLFCK